MSSIHKVINMTKILPGKPSWQQTMLRIKDPSKSVAFYKDNFGIEYTLTPGTKAAHDFLWTYDGVTLELTHNHGTESDSNFKGYHTGNEEKDGFGHVAFNCDDVYDATSKLIANGVTFKKKPDEGRMKGLAFAYDPDGYWVEIVKRHEAGKIPNYYNFSQTMLRVKDPKKSIEFYKSFGMNLVRESHYDSFSLYYLASNTEGPVDPSSDESKASAKMLFNPILELTHNHGTENESEFKYYHGNEEGRQGFGHIGFLVDDVYEACDSLRELGYGFKKEPDGGSMKGLAFAYDPDGYAIEIIKRGGIEFGDVKVEN